MFISVCLRNVGFVRPVSNFGIEWLTLLCVQRERIYRVEWQLLRASRGSQHTDTGSMTGSVAMYSAGAAA